VLNEHKGLLEAVVVGSDAEVPIIFPANVIIA
jgi:hypothetical protein